MTPSIDILTSNGYWTDDNCKVCGPTIMMGGCSKDIIKDPFNILKRDGLDTEEGILDFYPKNIGEYWFLHTKYQKIFDYDLFQIYAVNFNK